jgi:hypothetical protein
MSQIEDEINRLYQLPPAQFTAARNALAARAGNRAAEIRRLVKPSAAAWAVNQIFWRRSKTRDRLETVSARLRRTHAQHLSGKAADVASAEAEHRAALAAGVDAARDLLREIGDAATPATLQAVQETLETAVWRPLDGRLVRPLKPTGLEALAALKGGTFARPGRPADVLPFSAPSPVRAARTDQERKQREAERRREAAALARDLRQARAAEQRAAQALARAKARVEAGDRERTDLADALERVTAALAEHHAESDRARKQSERAAAERARLEARIAELDATS